MRRLVPYFAFVSFVLFAWLVGRQSYQAPLSPPAFQSDGGQSISEVPLSIQTPHPIRALESAPLQVPSSEQDIWQQLKQSPEDPLLNRAVGWMLLREQDNPERAIPFLEMAILADPSDGEALSALVESYAKTQGFDRGDGFLKKSLEAHPEEALTLWTARADLAFQRGELARAKQYAQKAHSLDPHFEPAAGLLGLIYHASKDERGVELLKQAQSPEHQGILVSALMDKGDFSEAEYRLRRLPEGPVKSDLRERLEKSRSR